jgi:hypothetical protein
MTSDTIPQISKAETDRLTCSMCFQCDKQQLKATVELDSVVQIWIQVFTVYFKRTVNNAGSIERGVETVFISFGKMKLQCLQKLQKR